MGYHVAKPRRSRAPIRAAVPLYPLASAQQNLPANVPLVPLQAPPDNSKKKLLIGILLVVGLLALLAWLNSREEKLESNPRPRSDVKKQSTAQMAKNLYRRLEARGGVSESTMRSLAQLARKA